MGRACSCRGACATISRPISRRIDALIALLSRSREYRAHRVAFEIARGWRCRAEPLSRLRFGWLVVVGSARHDPVVVVFVERTNRSDVEASRDVAAYMLRTFRRDPSTVYVSASPCATRLRAGVLARRLVREVCDPATPERATVRGELHVAAESRLIYGVVWWAPLEKPRLRSPPLAVRRLMATLRGIDSTE